MPDKNDKNDKKKDDKDQSKETAKPAVRRPEMGKTFRNRGEEVKK